MEILFILAVLIVSFGIFYSVRDTFKHFDKKNISNKSFK